jgi:hypothetical protein
MEVGGTFMCLLLYLQRKSPYCPLHRKLGEPHSQSTFCTKVQAMHISPWIFGRKSKVKRMDSSQCLIKQHAMKIFEGVKV